MKKQRIQQLPPWEIERRRQRELGTNTRSFGRAIGKKRKRNIGLDNKDIATFSCPQCQNNLRVDLIRLRQDLFECRKCGNVFVKSDIIDEFDFDGL